MGVSPMVAIILFVMNCKSLLQTSPTYSTGVTGSGPDGNGRLDYPGWAMAFTYYLVLSSTSMILIHMIRRKWIQYSRSQSATLPTPPTPSLPNQPSARNCDFANFCAIVLRSSAVRAAPEGSLTVYDKISKCTLC